MLTESICQIMDMHSEIETVEANSRGVIAAESEHWHSAIQRGILAKTENMGRKLS
jgi:hypothetical protein